MKYMSVTHINIVRPKPHSNFYYVSSSVHRGGDMLVYFVRSVNLSFLSVRLSSGLHCAVVSIVQSQAAPANVDTMLG